MRKILILGVAAMALSSCGGDDEGTFETDAGESVNYSVDSDDGETQVRITGDNGEEMVINSTAGSEAQLPDGFSLYPGASVVSTTTMNQGDGRGALVIMQSDAAPEAMVRFYREQAEAAGVEIQMEMNNSGSMMIGGEGASGTTFSFNASPSPEGTTGQLVVGQGMD